MGENTDVPGFERFLRPDAVFDAAGRDALVLGAGGAARAVALALARSGASRITVAVRDASRRAALIELLGGADVTVETSRSVAGGRAAARDLVVNATPVGSDGRSAPPLPALGAASWCVDLLYDHPAPGDGRRTRRPRSFGGLGMLLHQAAAFERWTGVKAPMDVMRRSGPRAAVRDG